jgi:hypothetical protein
MEISAGLLIGILVGVVGGILGPFCLILLMPRKRCPDCGKHLTRMRNCWHTPGVMRRCPTCGCGVDAKGRKVPEGTEA